MKQRKTRKVAPNCLLFKSLWRIVDEETMEPTIMVTELMRLGEDSNERRDLKKANLCKKCN